MNVTQDVPCMQYTSGEEVTNTELNPNPNAKTSSHVFLKYNARDSTTMRCVHLKSMLRAVLDAYS